MFKGWDGGVDGGGGGRGEGADSACKSACGQPGKSFIFTAGSGLGSGCTRLNPKNPLPQPPFSGASKLQFSPSAPPRVLFDPLCPFGQQCFPPSVAAGAKEGGTMESTAVLPWGGPSLRGEIWPNVRKHRIRGALAGARSVEELPLSDFFF